MRQRKHEARTIAREKLMAIDRLADEHRGLLRKQRANEKEERRSALVTQMYAKEAAAAAAAGSTAK